MNSDWSLSVVAAIADFFLKTTLALGVCAAMSRLLDSAKLRFVGWSSFVYGTTLYWLYLAYVVWTPQQQSTNVFPGSSQPVPSSFAIWQIPFSWASPLGLTLRIMGTVYLLTLCYFTFSHLRRRHHLKWVLSFTGEPPAEIAETFRSVATELRASNSRLLLFSGITSPATFGWLRPIIVLPTSCVAEDRLELEDILRHELHHVRRWDAIWNELAVAARSLLFFHPAIWYGVRKMQFDRELACDFAVVARSPGRRAEYAECLVRFAQLNVVSEHGGWGIDFAAPAHHLTVRIRSILAASKSSPTWVRYLRLASGVAISALFLGVAPSLAILLSFTHPPVTNTAFTPMVQPPKSSAIANRTSRRNRPFAFSAKEYGVAPGETPSSQGEDRLDLGVATRHPPDIALIPN